MDTTTKQPGQAYAEFMIAPYKEALPEIDTFESFEAWVREIFQEDADTFFEQTKDLDLEQSKHALEDFLIYQIPQTDESNPWYVAEYRDPRLERIFGPGTNEISVTIVDGDQTYQHQITEEFAKGILLGLSIFENNDLSVFFGDAQITLDNFPVDVADFDYEVLVDGKPYYFKSPDFIQGLNTASRWSKLTEDDFHKVVTDLYRVTDEDKISLDF